MEKVLVEIINQSANANPSYESEFASGMDVRAKLVEPIRLQPSERIMLKTGIYVAIPEGYEIQVRPRSGLAHKHGIMVVNSPGTIDADYRGECNVLLINTSNIPFVINPGDRIAQFVLCPVAKVQWVNVETLSETKRGDGGFGSSGTK